jgi:hypothetical protein
MDESLQTGSCPSMTFLYSAKSIPSRHGKRSEDGIMVLAPTITWDVAADGLVPVARSHSELIAGGLAVMLESRLQEEAALLSTLADRA